ncbi:hypothetical protein HOU22_gp05 [Escherichia phage C130_2]|uniref:Uncharacterized protein n=1 Tax=Escherichia phage C130_2 TaxID=2234093 RepID=A0A384ZRP1_9CAUD|nr:hypothetical protein HOU22_gp05 [Escherichia phage C130_2]AXC34317.1 hypothetical protein 1302_0007 [Escherichia phage C130_2]
MNFPKITYTASRSKKFITIEHAPKYGVSTKVTRNVTGKREARQIANELGGICWNF